MSYQSSGDPGRQKPTGPRKWNRASFVVAGTLTVAVAVSIGLVAAGGHSSSASLSSETTAKTKAPLTASSSSPPSSTSRASSPPSSASQDSSRSLGSAPWSSANCPSQLASWRGTGAGGQLQVVATDLTIATQAAASLHADPATGTVPPAAVTALRSAAASLRSSTQAAGKNLIPGCISGAHEAEVTGLANLSGAVAAVQSGSAEMATAIAGVNRYGTK